MVSDTLARYLRWIDKIDRYIDKHLSVLLLLLLSLFLIFLLEIAAYISGGVFLQQNIRYFFQFFGKHICPVGQALQQTHIRAPLTPTERTKRNDMT